MPSAYVIFGDAGMIDTALLIDFTIWNICMYIYISMDLLVCHRIITYYLMIALRSYDPTIPSCLSL